MSWILRKIFLELFIFLKYEAFEGRDEKRLASILNLRVSQCTENLQPHKVLPHRVLSNFLNKPPLFKKDQVIVVEIALWIGLACAFATAECLKDFRLLGFFL